MIAHLIALGFVVVTSYRPVASQTKADCTSRFNCTTSIDDGVTKFGVAVSQDFLKSGELHYGDVLYVPGYGNRIVNDTMNVRHKRCIDLMVFTREDEKAVGTRRLRVFKLEATQ